MKPNETANIRVRRKGTYSISSNFFFNSSGRSLNFVERVKRGEVLEPLDNKESCVRTAASFSGRHWAGLKEGNVWECESRN